MPEAEDFDDFVRGCSHRLYRVRFLLTGGDLARAEDLVAEALARVYRAWPRIWAGDAFDTDCLYRWSGNGQGAFRPGVRLGCNDWVPMHLAA